MTSLRRLAPLAWVLAVTATALNGIVVGYGAVWFQLFGDSPDAADYRLSAGGYGAAAVVLALAVPALLTHGGPRWLGGAVDLGPRRARGARPAPTSDQPRDPGRREHRVSDGVTALTPWPVDR